MKSVVILLLIVSSAFAVDLDAQRKDVVDFLLNSFGLGEVWNTVQTVGANLFGQFQSNLTQLLFAGQQAWNNAKPIFSQLVSDLQNHVGDATGIVAQAVASLSQVLASSGKRSADKDVVDFLLNSFGLGNVWSTVQQAGSNLVGQFQAILTQLLFAGQQAWNNAKPIFGQLVADLQAHASDAVPLVANAVAQLTQVLSGAGKRDLVEKNILDLLLNQFGLANVWTTVQQAGSNLVAQFQATLTQLLFAGQNAINQTKPILSGLISNLQNHVGDAVPIIRDAIAQINQILSGAVKPKSENNKDVVDFLLNSFGLGNVWSTIQQAGSNLVGQFQAILTQLLFAGQQAWNNAKPIFGQLVRDLQAHASDAVPLVANAVAQLTQVLSGAGKRDLVEKSVVDFLLNSFGLGNVWSTIQQAGTNLVGQFQATLTQLLFAGQQAWNNAKPIFSQLIADLQNHVGEANVYVAQAISSLNEVLSTHLGGGY